MKQYISIFCSLILLFIPLFSHTSQAQSIQRIEIPSSPNPVGSGARALGMGGAFIAVADDATAASWNPGGLIQLETPEISAVYNYFQRMEENTFGTNPEASGSHHIKESALNYLSFAYPFTLWDYTMIVSVNFQNLYDFNREWKFPLIINADGLYASQNVDYTQKGNLSALGIAYCAQITPDLSCGLTLNFWRDTLLKNEWEQTTYQRGTGTYSGNSFTYNSESMDKYSFNGFNYNLGILWNITSIVTFGAVLKTPFEATIKHEGSFSSIMAFPSYPAADSSVSIPCEGEEKLDMPLACGVGLALRLSDAFTASLDIYRTDWDDFLYADEDGVKTSPISGRSQQQSHIDPTHQVRMGAEYLYIHPRYIIPLRGGLFYDPAPAEGATDDFFGLSLGTGYASGRFIFDIAYQYRTGTNVGSSILQHLDFSQDVHEHTLYSSLIIHF